MNERKAKVIFARTRVSRRRERSWKSRARAARLKVSLQSRYLRGVAKMPPKTHYHGKSIGAEFDLNDSDVVDYLISDAGVKQWLFNEMVARGLIVFNRGLSKWAGCGEKSFKAIKERAAKVGGLVDSRNNRARREEKLKLRLVMWQWIVDHSDPGWYGTIREIQEIINTTMPEHVSEGDEISYHNTAAAVNHLLSEGYIRKDSITGRYAFVNPKNKAGAGSSGKVLMEPDTRPTKFGRKPKYDLQEMVEVLTGLGGSAPSPRWFRQCHGRLKLSYSHFYRMVRQLEQAGLISQEGWGGVWRLKEEKPPSLPPDHGSTPMNPAEPEQAPEQQQAAAAEAVPEVVGPVLQESAQAPVPGPDRGPIYPGQARR